MKKLIVAEKPKVALKIAANGRRFLGDFKLNGVLLTKNYLEKNEESLAKAVKKIGYIENQNYIISFAEGHLVALYDAKDYNPDYRNWRNIPFPYVPNPFKTKVSPEKEYLYKNLEKLMNSSQVDEIINACDGDREGSNIFHLIYNQAKCTKPVKRLWVESHTEEKLVKALQNMEDETIPKHENLRKAGYCRTKSDWLMGALLTAKATIELGSGKDIITVGRVQTAVLAEIVRVEELIRNFKSKKFYHIQAKFKTKDGKVYEGVCDSEDYDDIKKAQDVVNRLKKEGKIADYNIKKESKYCPPLHDQTSLAIEMSKSTNISPDETLNASQSLYEQGYATYPRTASRYITQSDVSDFGKMLNAISSVNPLALKYKFDKNNRRIVDDSKVESHTAIIPTSEIPDLSKLDKNERAVYEELVRRAIAVNFPPAVDEKQSIVTTVSGLDFKSSGTVELDRGWREVYNITTKDNPLPQVRKDDVVKVLSLEPKEVVTQPPKRYTEATILQFMESCGKKIENDEMRELMKNKGIGTSATRAEILKKLKNVNYIVVKGKTIYPTDKGVEVIHKFPVDELKNAEFTGEMEYQLYKVEKGELSEDDYMKMIIDLYKLSCEKVNNKQIGRINNSADSLGKCPLCGSGVVKRKGKFGEFYGCNGYKNGCKFTINKICGKLLTEKQVQTLLEKGQTGRIKGFKKKDGKELPSAKVILKQDGQIELDFS
jgi:DNA topoisomerase-3